MLGGGGRRGTLARSSDLRTWQQVKQGEMEERQQGMRNSKREERKRLRKKKKAGSKRREGSKGASTNITCTREHQS